MPKLIISHINGCNGVIADGYLLYDSTISKNNKIVEFYTKGQLVARLRGDYSEGELKLEDTIFEDEKEELLHGNKIMNEYCKYAEKSGTHEEIIYICKNNHNECVKLYPCAFFVAYHKEIS